MACLEMYNSEHKGAPPMSPRISFSNDFVESHSQIANNNTSSSSSRGLRSDAPISSDFEFSTVSHNSLQLSADELFFKGRILPMKDNHKFHKPPSSSSSAPTTTTLRDELLAGDDDDEDGDVFSLKPPQSKARWKGFLSLRKSHIGSKKTDLTPHRSFTQPTNFFSFPLHDQPTTPQGILREEQEEEETSGAAEMEMKM